MSDLHWQTAITKIEPNKISVRGYILADLLGKISFSQMVYLLFKGEIPPDHIGKMIDAILVSSVDHGTTPPSALASLTVASTGAPLNASVAAGILAISKFHGGAIEECMLILLSTKKYQMTKKCTPVAAVRHTISDYQSNKKRLSGFGHRLHSDDPRTKRLFEIAAELHISGDFVKLARVFEEELEKSSGKHLPVNVDGAIAALLCEMDFDPVLANAFFIIARTPGLVAHIYEEITSYKPMRQIHPTDVEYDGPAEKTL
jgi:citrate synthase